MSEKPDPSHEAPEVKPGSVEEPGGTEFQMDEVWVDAVIARNRDEIIGSLEQAERDFKEGRCFTLEEVDAEIEEMLNSLEREG